MHLSYIEIETCWFLFFSSIIYLQEEQESIYLISVYEEGFIDDFIEEEVEEEVAPEEVYVMKMLKLWTIENELEQVMYQEHDFGQTLV